MGLLAATLACVGCSGEDRNTEPGAGPHETEAASGESTFSVRAKQVLDETDQLLERSRDFQAADALAALPANPLAGFHYRFDDHLAEANLKAADSGREAGIGSKPRTAPESIALVPVKSPYQTILEDGRTAIQIDHQAGDVLRNTTPLHLAKDEIAEFELRLKLHHHAAVVLGWSSDDVLDSKRLKNQAQGPTDWIRIDTVPDGQFHTYRVNARNALQAAKNPGDIQQIFLRFPKDQEDQIEIEPLRILSPRDRYSRNAIGTDYVELEMEMRHVIHGEAPFELEYSVVPPEGPVSFHAGVASLDSKAPVTFSLVLREASGERVLLRKKVVEAGAWNDVQFEFESTGEPMILALKTESPSSNIAFWSNPILYGPRNQPFNILMIIQDTLRADHLSAYGYFRPTSPRFDAYAKQGVLFERAYSNASKTRPSAASMMTGLYPTAVGVWNFHEMLDDRFITLAEVLRNQGFATAGFIGNPNAGPYAGVHQGFSLLVHQFAGRKQQSHERYLIRTIEDILSERLYDWLDEVKSRNFFLYVHLVDPHGVYDAPAPYDRWYQEKPEGEPGLDYDVRLDPLRAETPTADGRRRLYDGEIRYNDEYLAKFLEELNERGLLRRTLVIFASDHGEFLGDRDVDLWAHHPPGYVEVLHVPLMMVLPGTLPEGKRVPENVQLLDIMPTVLELAGVETESLLLQGNSLVSLMQGQKLDFWRDRIVVSDEVIGRPHDDRRGWGSVFHRELHYLNSRKFSDRAALANGSVDPRTTLKVFDLRRDPREQRDLGTGADTPLAPASVDFLEKLIARNTEVSEALTQDASETIELDPTIQDQLRGLGYLLEEDEETERP